MNLPKELMLVLPKRIAEEIISAEELKIGHTLQEIRIRNKRPLVIKTEKGETVLGEGVNQVVSESEMNAVVARVSAYSLYAFEEELRQGFLTIAGGHRVGFCGKAVLEDGKIKTLRKISSINIRFAREVIGCGERWMPYLYEGDRLCHTLIISPPGCGKTTLLRDCIRLISNGWGKHRGQTIGVIDERCEIAPMVDGVAQMDIGIYTDVLEGCPKAEGMLLLLRSMAPQVIAVDELGKAADFVALESLLCAGVTVLSTVHGHDMEELNRNPHLHQMMEKQTFGRYVFLSQRDGVGTVERIISGSGEVKYEREGEVCYYKE